MAAITIGTTTREERSVVTRAALRVKDLTVAAVAVMRDLSREPAHEQGQVPGGGIDTFYRAGAPRL